MSKLSDLSSGLESNYKNYIRIKDEKLLVDNLKLFSEIPKKELNEILKEHKYSMAEDLENDLKALILVAKSYKNYALARKNQLTQEKCERFLSIAHRYFTHISKSISKLPQHQLTTELGRQQREADYYLEETQFLQAQMKLFFIKKQIEEKVENKQLCTQLAKIVSAYTHFQSELKERYKDEALRERFSISRQFIATIAEELEEAKDLLAKTPKNTRKHPLNDEGPSSSSRKPADPAPKRSRKLTNEEEAEESTTNSTPPEKDRANTSASSRKRLRQPARAGSNKGSTTDKASTEDNQSVRSQNLPLKKRRIIKEGDEKSISSTSTRKQGGSINKAKTTIAKQRDEKTRDSAAASTTPKPSVVKVGRRLKRMSNSRKRDDEESEETAVIAQSSSLTTLASMSAPVIQPAEHTFKAPLQPSTAQSTRRAKEQRQLVSESSPSIGRAAGSFFATLAKPSQSVEENKSRQLEEDKKKCSDSLIQYKELLSSKCHATSQTEKLGHIFLLAAIELKKNSHLFEGKNTNPALVIAIKLFLKCAEYSSKTSSDAFKKLTILSNHYSELFANFSRSETEDGHIESLRIENYRQLSTFNINGASVETLVDTVFAQLDRALTTDSDYNLVKTCCISLLERSNTSLRKSESIPTSSSFNPN